MHAYRDGSLEDADQASGQTEKTRVLLVSCIGSTIGCSPIKSHGTGPAGSTESSRLSLNEIHIEATLYQLDRCIPEIAWWAIRNIPEDVAALVRFKGPKCSNHT